MIVLSEQQLKELQSDPPRALDPQSQERYVLIREAVYDRMQALLATERLSKTEQQSVLHAAALRAGWNDFEMDIYDNEPLPGAKP